MCRSRRSPWRLWEPTRGYVFADPEVEARRGGDKALLRMGPANGPANPGEDGGFRPELGLTP